MGVREGKRKRVTEKEGRKEQRKKTNEEEGTWVGSEAART